jgi:hypothetical protein
MKLNSIACLLLLALSLGVPATQVFDRSELGSLQMSFSLQELHDEIENDPLGIGYKNPDTTWKGDQVIADLINAKNYKVDRASVGMEQVRATCTYAAYDTLSIDEQEWIRWMTPNGGELQITADVKLQLSGRTLASNGAAGTGADGDSFWAAAHDQDMAPAMLALIEVDGSRAEVLWGAETSVSVSQVAYAANL